MARCADVSHVERSNDGAAQVPYLAKSINHERMPVLISIRQTSKPGCRDHPCRRPNALDLGAAGPCPSSVKHTPTEEASLQTTQTSRLTWVKLSWSSKVSGSQPGHVMRIFAPPLAISRMRRNALQGRH